MCVVPAPDQVQAILVPGPWSRVKLWNSPWAARADKPSRCLPRRVGMHCQPTALCQKAHEQCPLTQQDATQRQSACACWRNSHRRYCHAAAATFAPGADPCERKNVVEGKRGDGCGKL